MRLAAIKSYLALIACGAYVLLARALHSTIVGPAAGPVRESSWVETPLIAVIVAAFVIYAVRRWEPSPGDWGLVSGKKSVPFLVVSLLWILFQWWKGDSTDAAAQHSRLTQLAGLILVSQFVFRVIFLRVAFRLIPRKGPWISALIVAVSGVLFALAHPLPGWQPWWFASSVLTSSIVIYSDCILFGWVTDLERVAKDSGIRLPPAYFVGIMVVYIIVAATRRFLFSQRAPAPLPDNVRHL